MSSGDFHGRLVGNSLWGPGLPYLVVLLGRSHRACAGMKTVGFSQTQGVLTPQGLLLWVGRVTWMDLLVREVLRQARLVSRPILKLRWCFLIVEGCSADENN